MPSKPAAKKKPAPAIKAPVAKKSAASAKPAAAPKKTARKAEKVVVQEVVAQPAAPVVVADTKTRKRKGKEKLIIAPEAAPLDMDAKRSRLKTLIALGKERGYLTYAEINDHLPDEMVDAEQIESIIATFADMSIQVFDEAPAAEELLLTNASRSEERSCRERV